MLSPSDALFLYGESREMMFHVAGLLPFTAAPDTPRDHLRHLMDEIRAGSPEVCWPWNQMLRLPELPRSPLQAWVEAREVDLDYHVRRTALPTPGDERELGIVVSRLHGHRIDLHRPPWELHLIEGLERDRFAIYVKVHHALVDGISAMRMLVNALTHDPDERGRPLFFAVPQPPRPPRPTDAGEAEAADGIHFTQLIAAVREQYGAARTALRALLDVRRSAQSGVRDLVSPAHAPNCILNTRISKSRRFATQLLDAGRMRAVAKAAGGTLNDVVLAVSGGSLRRYLMERDALPAAPLVAMLPVSVRAADDPAGGNAVGAILATLATDLDDPSARLAAIIASTTAAKKQLQGMSRAAILQYSAVLTAPSMLQLIPGAAGRIRPPFNVVISNVPGPERPLYFRGARLEASYPMSIPVHGQALNITCNSYAGSICVGFTGCRETVPHLQRLAVYFGEALTELEAAVA
jgi:WS/DGAT/MGAT family acyltransferase